MPTIRGCMAYCAARLGRTEDALRWLASILPAIDRAPGWLAPALLSHAAEALEELGHTDHIEIVERNVREKWLEPDVREVLLDASCTLAQLCGLQGKCEEAAELFAAARASFEKQGVLTRRAAVDFYEARMYLRGGAPGDRER